MQRRALVALAVLSLAAIALTGALAASPFRRQDDVAYRLLAESTDVDVTCRQLFTYLGNSANAHRWSVFVDHITPLNVASVADGAAGSIRRSFKNADESGMRWDEYFTEVAPDRKRQLRIYNVVDAPLRTPGTLLTEQLYQPIAPSRCRLSFTLFFEREPSALDELKMRVASYRIAAIFRRNIANIKRLNEQLASWQLAREQRAAAAAGR
jgi:ADP-ribose pyrophosphatase YjhB (NUDIX family)